MFLRNRIPGKFLGYLHKLCDAKYLLKTYGLSNRIESVIAFCMANENDVLALIFPEPFLFMIFKTGHLVFYNCFGYRLEDLFCNRQM